MLLAIAACAKPPKLSATVDVSRRAPGSILLMLRVKNLGERATTPIAPVLVLQTRSGAAWSKPATEIAPAAFVLNRHEQRDIFKVLNTNATLVRATLTIREQENGRVDINRRIEKTVPTSPPPAPSTAAPAIPPRPGK